MSDSRKICHAASAIMVHMMDYAHIANGWDMAKEGDYEELCDSVEKELENFLKGVKSDG